MYFINLEKDTFEREIIFENDTTGFTYLGYQNNKIYISTKEYEWGEVRSFEIKNKTDIKEVIPQIYNNLLVGCYFYDNYIICKHKTLNRYYLRVYDIDGNFIRKFDAPENMNFSVRFYNSETKDLFVTFFSEVISAQNFKLNIDTGEIRNFYNDFIRPLPTIFPLNYFITKKITFKSRDNKDVPITIIHKKNIVLDGTNPTLLKAYGGFGVVSGSNYNTGLLYFLEQGGIYAFAEIRGGGEKGLKWHKDAVGLKKMNSFNDFIDASEFLINEKYTSPDKLAISGGSYGGLVVGVAITQRPDLYKVAIPEMGVFDMLTYSEYSVGKFHLDEFGDPEKKPDFNYLLGYSPYNKVKEDVNYPTTLLITGENDDRVPPFNSYKFAAALQNRTAQKNPVFLKTLGNSGHYGKNSTYQSRINESAEFYGFLLYYLTK
jgi:prolyl oligopeptidase